MPAGHLVTETETLLREWLKTSGLRPGSRLPSERALSRQLGQKHYAVNRAIARMVADGLILRDGYKLTYAEPKVETPALVCDMVIARRSKFVKVFRKLAHEMDVDLRIHTFESTEEGTGHLELLEAARASAVLYAPPFYESPEWQVSVLRLFQQGIPTLSVNRETYQIPSVVYGYPTLYANALQHFKELGHRHIVRVYPTVEPLETVNLTPIEWKALCETNNITASQDGTFWQASEAPLREEAARLAELLTGEWRSVSAVLFHDRSVPLIPHLVEKLQGSNRQVPENLSLLALNGHDCLTACNPPIASLEFDPTLLAETSLRMIQRIVRRQSLQGIRPLPFCVKVDPLLLHRGSLAPGPYLPTSVKKQESRPKWDNAKNLEELQYSAHRPYARSANIAEARFRRLDLREWMNRPLRFRRGWLGDLPLRKPDPGTAQIHGVPFDILGGNSRTECGAIVFRTVSNFTGSSHQLPSKLEIPVKAKVAAIYFLHGCGFAKFLHPFAKYSFYNKTKLIESVPLVSLGYPPPGFDLGNLAAEPRQPNIQDWWSDFPQMDFPHARMAALEEHESTPEISRHSYLYTLEWVNPTPETAVSHIEIEVDAEQATALGILAISVLKPLDAAKVK